MNHLMENIEHTIEKRAVRREQKRRPRMRVSGKSVFAIQTLMKSRRPKK